MNSRCGRISPVLLCVVVAACAAVPAAAQTEDTSGSGGFEAGELLPLDVRPAVLTLETLEMSGRVGPEQAGRTVRIERRERSRVWRAIASAVADPNGAFVATWRTGTPGRYALRAVVERGPDRATTAATNNDFFTRVSVFRPAVASWYGPGFFGRRTACGKRLTSGMLGVAHKSLRCGKRVEFLFDGRTITVPVIDRGPYVAGREFDLTQATAEALGFSAFGRIGALLAR